MTIVTAAKITRRRVNAASHADPKIRLIRLWGLISIGEGQSPASLAIAFNVNTRTIHRDLEILQKAGCKIKFDRKTGRYRTSNAGFLPPMDFLQDEALALMLLGQHIPDDPVLEDAAKRAMAKIRSLLPPVLQDQIAPLEKRVSVRPVGTDNAEAARDVYSRLQQAIGEQREVLCQYDAARSSEKVSRDATFSFRPYHLLFSNRAWYVIGYRVDRQATRSLKLIRFTKISLQDKRFTMPPDFTVAGYLGQCWRMIPGGKRHHIVIRIDPDFATGIAETQWHGTQDVKTQADGSNLISFDVDGLEEIVWWILGMGPHCQVLQPPELINRVMELSSMTAKLYATQHPDIATK